MLVLQIFKFIYFMVLALYLPIWKNFGEKLLDMKCASILSLQFPYSFHTGYLRLQTHTQNT